LKIYHNIEDFIQPLTRNSTVALSAPSYIPEDSSMITGCHRSVRGRVSIFVSIMRNRIRKTKITGHEKGRR
jgi:hypothetical protein